MEIVETRAEGRPPVLAVVPHFGSPAGSRRAAAAFAASRGVDLTVLLVDNRGDLEAEGWPPGVELVRPGRNLGFCAAVNLALATARERGVPYLLLANDDTLPEPDCVAALVDALEADESLAGAGPLLVSGGRVWSAGSRFRPGPNLVAHRFAGEDPARVPLRPLAADFLAGALALYRTEVLAEVGGLREEYFMYYEDADLGRRLRALGRRAVVVPWARAEHHGTAASGGGASPLRKYLMGLNEVRFLRAHGSPLEWAAFLFFDVLLWPVAWLAFAASPKRRRAHEAKGRGLVAGLCGRRAGPEAAAALVPPGGAG